MKKDRKKEDNNKTTSFQSRPDFQSHSTWQGECALVPHTFPQLRVRAADDVSHAARRLPLQHHLEGFGICQHGQVRAAQDGLQVLPVHVCTFAAVMEDLELPVPRLRSPSTALPNAMLWMQEQKGQMKRK